DLIYPSMKIKKFLPIFLILLASCVYAQTQPAIRKYMLGAQEFTATPFVPPASITGQTTTLAGAIADGSATSISVNVNISTPSTSWQVPFVVSIDSENMKVTSKGSGTNWTV